MMTYFLPKFFRISVAIFIGLFPVLSSAQTGTITFNTLSATSAVNWEDGQYGSTDIGSFSFRLFSGNKSTGISDGANLYFDDSKSFWGVNVDGVSPFLSGPGASALIFKETGGKAFAFKGFSINDVRFAMKVIIVEGFRSGFSTGTININSTAINSPSFTGTSLFSTFNTSTFVSSKFGNVDEVRIYTSSSSPILII